jgi:hypothetical protein
MNCQLNQAWSGIKQFQKRFDMFTGGGFRAFAKRRLRFLREKRGTNLSHVREPEQGSEICQSVNLDNPATRDQILLAPVARGAQIIEIGPSYNPIAPKAGGWNTKTLDHTTREKLIAHYRGHAGVDVNRIEEVDFIWTGGLLADAVPKGFTALSTLSLLAT